MISLYMTFYGKYLVSSNFVVFFLGEVVGLGGRHTFLEVAIVFLCQLFLQ